MKEYHIRRTDETDWGVYYGDSVEDAVKDYYIDQMLDGENTLEIRDPQLESVFKVIQTSVSYSVYYTGKKVTEQEEG